MTVFSRRLLFAISIFFLISCSKDKASQEEIPQLNIKVISTDGEPMENVLIALMEEGDLAVFRREGEPTSEEGLLSFPLISGQPYNLYLIPSNSYGTLSDTPSAKYIQTGFFESLEEIANSPNIASDVPVKVGDPKYADINGDAVINAQDLVIPLNGPTKGNIDITLSLTKQQASD